MRKQRLRILGINPHSRYLSIAIFHGIELRESMIRSLSGKTIKERAKKAESILLKIITQYRITVIALKKIPEPHRTKNYEILITTIKELAKKHKIKVFEYTLTDIKRNLCRMKLGNKQTLMNELIQKFPFLEREFERERKIKNQYHVRMFEAVAVGLACHNDLDVKSRKVEDQKNKNYAE